jgi:hypothetical protein
MYVCICTVPTIIKNKRKKTVKIIAISLSQHDKKHVVPTSLSGIRVKKKKCLIYVVA